MKIKLIFKLKLFKIKFRSVYLHQVQKAHLISRTSLQYTRSRGGVGSRSKGWRWARFRGGVRDQGF